MLLQLVCLVGRCFWVCTRRDACLLVRLLRGLPTARRAAERDRRRHRRFCVSGDILSRLASLSQRPFSLLTQINDASCAHACFPRARWCTFTRSHTVQLCGWQFWCTAGGELDSCSRFSIGAGLPLREMPWAIQVPPARTSITRSSMVAAILYGFGRPDESDFDTLRTMEFLTHELQASDASHVAHEYDKVDAFGTVYRCTSWFFLSTVYVVHSVFVPWYL